MRPAILAALAALPAAAAWQTQDAAADEGDRLTVSRSNVNVRSGPSTQTEVLLTINPGEQIVEIAAKGEWFFVEFPALSQRGWVYGPLLEPAGSTPVATVAAAQPAAPQAPAPSAAAEAAEAESALPVAEPPAGGDAPYQAAAVDPGDEPAAVKSFRDTVVELNERAVSVAGINLFTDVRSTGGGGVQVLATDTWTTVPEAGQSSYMNALFERWQSVASGLGPLSLQIVDPSGKVVMERSGS